MVLTSKVAQMQPSTPSKHDEINSYFIRLNRLSPETSKLRERSKGESPSERHATKQERCQDHIIYCFWKARAELDLAIENFEARLKIKMPSDPILYLLKILPDPANTTSFGRPTMGRSFQQPPVPKLHINQPARLKRPTTPIVSDEDDESFDTPPETPTHPRPAILHMSSSKKRTYVPDDQAATQPSAKTSFSSSSMSFRSSFPSSLFNGSFGPDGTGAGVQSFETSVTSATTTFTSKGVTRTEPFDRRDSSEPKRRKLDVEKVETSGMVNSGQKSDNRHFQIRWLHKAGLFCDPKFPANLSKVPIHQVVEGTRIALEHNLPPYALLESGTPNHYESFYKSCAEKAHNLLGADLRVAAIKRDVFEAATTNPGTALKLRLNFNDNPTPKREDQLFKLSIKPLALERSDRFRRAFGWDRIAFLDVPVFENVPGHLKSQKQGFLDALNEWLDPQEGKELLGRIWNVIHAKYVNAGKKSKKADKEVLCKVFLFASSGCNITPILLGPWRKIDMDYKEAIKWFLPLDQLQDQPWWANTAARLDLGFSTTIPTIIIPPNQVRESEGARKARTEFGKNIVSDATDDKTGYSDEALTGANDNGSETVMNDGCARISLGAIREIVKSLNASGYEVKTTPTWFQGRFNGAKGVWHMSSSYQHATDDDWEVWIEITPSQRKFPRHAEDAVIDFDPLRWNFEVLTWNDGCVPSALNLAFIPILQDRGVSLDTLKSIAAEQIKAEEAEILEAAKRPETLLQWLHRHFSVLEKRRTGVSWSGAMPRSDVEKLIFFLQHGMFIQHHPFLADLFCRVVADYFSKLADSMSIRMATSSMVLGIADPFCILEPGEVFCQFSRPLTDENDHPVTCLDGRKLIAARHPSLIASDMQALKAVWRSEFRDFYDVVIFSSKGQVPGAAKLQGGDYDGDTFWLCWNTLLTRDFLNAPLTRNRPEAKRYGISEDTRTVGELMGPQKSIDTFLHSSLKFRGQVQMLGTATKFFERLAYAKRNLHDEGVLLVAYMHDLLIDSTKNGYLYTNDLFKDFIAQEKSIDASNVPKKTEYERGMEAGIKFEEGELRLKCKPPKEMMHSVDVIFFKVIVPRLKTTIDLLTRELAFEKYNEDAFQAFLNKVVVPVETDAGVSAEIKELTEKLKKIRGSWFYKMNKDGSVPADIINNCYKLFQEYEPKRLEHPEIKRWLSSRLESEPCSWPLIKAAYLWKTHTETSRPNILFHLAGRQLAYIKANSYPDTDAIIAPISAMLKPGKVTPTSLATRHMLPSTLGSSSAFTTVAITSSDEGGFGGTDFEQLIDDDDFYSTCPGMYDH